MDLSFLGDILGGSAVGGILGAIAPIFAEAQKRKAKAQDNAHELEMAKVGLDERRLDQAHQLLVADKELDIAEAEGEIAVSMSEAQGQIEIIKGQNAATGATAWIRPFLTAYAMLLATALGWAVFDSAGGLEAFTGPEKADLVRMVVQNCFQIAFASFMFWFTARQIAKK